METRNQSNKNQNKFRYLNTVFRQFVRVCNTTDVITFDARVCNLACNVSVAETYNQPIFRRIVLVLVLENQTFPGIVIGFTFATPLEFNLVSFEILLVLDNLHETLKKKIAL